MLYSTGDRTDQGTATYVVDRNKDMTQPEVDGGAGGRQQCCQREATRNMG